MSDPQKYRDEAKRLRSEAAAAISEEARLQILDIAAQYEMLATLIEAQKKSSM